MRFDYDLVMVAASPVALEVAYRYAPVGRIGLVLPPPEPQWQWQWQRWWLSVAPPSRLDAASWQRFQGMVQQGQRLYAPTVLNLSGIDVLSGTGKFVWQPQCHFQIGQDRLYARGYLLVDAPPAMLPTTPVMQGTGVEIAEALAWQSWSGDCSHQAWHVGGDRLVPTEDPWFNDRLQAALEALGITVQLQCGRSTPRLPPALAPLNLEPLNTDRHGWLLLNRYGRTSHPQIYACGAWHKGYTLPSLTAAEAGAIAANLLLGHPSPLQYRCQPWWLPIPTPLARVGWNHRQAQRQWGPTVQVQTIHYPADDPNWGEMILGSNGKLLGVTLQGTAAIAASRVFGLCLQQGLSAMASLEYTGWSIP
ncbi:hypothetical protein L5470_03415 [Synechococcus sp. PCC 6717]|nr:hypothetical protein [Synechococcus sp. PCC 6717]